MTHNRKGVSLSLNMIVVAVICLLVLVIISYLVAKNSNIFDKGTSDCSAPKSMCSSEQCGQGSASEFPIRKYAGSCPAIGGQEQVCCSKL